MMREVTGKLKGRLMRTNTKRCDVTHRQIGSIGIEYTVIDEFTIVEILHGSKHYHGLTKMNDTCDTWDESTGIVIAFRRAFDLMVKDQFKPKVKVPLENKSHTGPFGFIVGDQNGLPTGIMISNPCKGIPLIPQDKFRKIISYL